MDRGNVDLELLFTLNQAGTLFMRRAKQDTRYKQRYSNLIDKSKGLRCYQSILLIGIGSSENYTYQLR